MELDAPSCCVCLEEYQVRGPKRPKALACGHALCGSCFENIPELLCPTCRKPLDADAPYHTEMIEILKYVKTVQSTEKDVETQALRAQISELEQIIILQVEEMESLNQKLHHEINKPPPPPKQKEGEFVSSKGKIYYH